MAITIRALDRGGWSAHGGRYDPRIDAVIASGWNSEEISATVSFSETISSMTKEQNGIVSTTPSLSAGTATMELSSLDTSGGSIDLIATLASGQVRRLTIATPPSPSAILDYQRSW